MGTTDELMFFSATFFRLPFQFFKYILNCLAVPGRVVPFYQPAAGALQLLAHPRHPRICPATPRPIVIPHFGHTPRSPAPVMA
jgi:hypothetical protein